MLAKRLMSLGAPPRWFGWRWVPRDTPAGHVARRGGRARIELLQVARTSRHPLPATARRREELPDDAGWWGFAMRDVPTRSDGETYLAHLSGMTVAAYRDRRGNFTVGMVDRSGRAVDMPQIHFTARHAAMLRGRMPRVHLRRATWVTERVYDNHAHWLTAHLPKLLLLKKRGLLDDLVLPEQRTPAIDASLGMIGLAPARFRCFDPATILDVDRLTVLVTDRFRPELLRSVRAAYARSAPGPPGRRVFVSRARARGRRLLNETQLWPQLVSRGFERVMMEDLAFPEQVRLMQETAVLVAPHGAGIANMIFCPEGADVVEIADVGYPNPNFYAMAVALSHRYWLLPAGAEGEGHPLDRDLRADVPAVTEAIDRIDALRNL